VEPFRGAYRPRDMWRSLALILGLAGLLAGCSLGGGNGAVSGPCGELDGCSVKAEGNVTPTLLAEMRVSRIPLRFTGGTPLASVTCDATRYTGFATCSGHVPGSGAGQKLTVRLRLTVAGKPVPTCTLGNGPSPNPTLFCVS
jgi:hypothetical protein